MEQEFTIETVISGHVDVEIKGVGKFGADDLQQVSLGGFAGHVYTVLTGKVFRGVAEDFFELVSVDLKQGKAVFRIK